jgi:hypothetical protein
MPTAPRIPIIYLLLFSRTESKIALKAITNLMVAGKKFGRGSLFCTVVSISKAIKFIYWYSPPALFSTISAGTSSDRLFSLDSAFANICAIAQQAQLTTLASLKKCIDW